MAAFGSSFKQEVEATFNVFAERGLRAIYGMALNDTDMPAELLQACDKALDDARDLAAKYSRFRVENESAQFRRGKGFIIANRIRAIERKDKEDQATKADRL